MSKDLYAVLGLKKEDKPTDEQIRRNYRKLCLKYHPDRQGGKTDEEKKAAEEKFKEVTEAYSVLSDTDKKSRYDTFGTYGDGSDMGGGNPFDGFNFNFGGGGVLRLTTCAICLVVTSVDSVAVVRQDHKQNREETSRCAFLSPSRISITA